MEINDKSKIEFVLTEEEFEALETVCDIFTDIDGAVSERSGTNYYYEISDALRNIKYDIYDRVNEDGEGEYIYEVEL